jgi:hypothetical protein
MSSLEVIFSGGKRVIKTTEVTSSITEMYYILPKLSLNIKYAMMLTKPVLRDINEATIPPFMPASRAPLKAIVDA